MRSAKVFYPRWTRDELVALLRARLPALAEKLPLERAVLFGSWAKGRATAMSDVDLFLLYKGPPRPDAYALTKKTLMVPGLEVHAYAKEEYEALRSTLEAMLEGGIELWP